MASATRRRSGTGVERTARAIATWITFGGLAGAQYCIASDLTIEVVDHDGRGIEHVVAQAMPINGAPAPAVRSAVMDQKDRAFVPEVLVVAVGSSVDFPNNDSVSHQVYSFSPAKRFQLPLYKGETHPPVIFDQTGLVVLGCNIHDSMVGYIYVTAAPYFGTTDAHGTVTLKSLPRGDYQLTIMSPYIADAAASLTRTVHIEGDAAAAERVQLRQPLRARPEPRPRRRDWDY